MPLRKGYDIASGLTKGAREAQEDAILVDHPGQGAVGFVALADGLGGHAAGAVASELGVSHAMDVLVSARDETGNLKCDIPNLLNRAAIAANQSILDHSHHHPDTRGMGATLVLLALLPDRVHWLSIGDSPLYLWRGGDLVQLNETHSLASQLELLVRAGELTAEEAATHPERNCLTSALGEFTLHQVDCPEMPFFLWDDDVLVVASDGILTLSQEDIAETVTDGQPGPCRNVVDHLLARVARRDHPTQDNVSIAVIQRGAPLRSAAPRKGRGEFAPLDQLKGIVGAAFPRLGLGRAK